MESLEIDMPWAASTPASKIQHDSPEIDTPPHRQVGPHDSDDTQAGPVDTMDTMKSTADIDDGEETCSPDSVGGVEAWNKSGQSKDEETEGQKRKSSKCSKKRKIDTTGVDQLLDRFGPPRQSIRARIKLEFQTAPEPPKEVNNSSKSKQTKNRRNQTKRSEVAASTTAVPVGGKSMDVGQSSKTPKKSKSASKFKTDRKPEKLAKEEQPAFDTDHAAIPLTHVDVLSEEIAAYQPGSLEDMGTTSVETETRSLTLEQRLPEKKRKGRKVRDVKVEQDTDKGIPLVSMSRIAAPEPIRPGIRASTFARVMRLVADLPPVKVKPKKTKRRVPEHRPPVWAQSRQELCEALPYYRAFQSGLYLSQGVAFGYLLDGFPAPRDVCAHNGRVIISHGGGHCVRPTLDDGQVLPPVLAGDQLVTDFRVATLVRAWQRRVPLVLIAGSGYELLPFKLNCSYAVLGWYWVSLVWTEAEPVASGIRPPAGRDWYKRVKVRFDWVEIQGIPWWEQSAGPALQETAIYEEVVTSPQAKRIQVAELVHSVSIPGATPGYLGPDIKEDSPRDYDSDFVAHTPDQDEMDTFVKAQMSFGLIKPDATTTNPRRALRYLCDPESGLLTPPITPPTPDTRTMPTIETAYVAGADVVASEDTLRRRIPGNHLMANFEKGSSNDRLVDPYLAICQQCRYCPEASPTIYREGWMCLNTACTAYWMSNTTIGLLPISPGMRLSYDSRFLTPAATASEIKPPYDVVPPRPKSGIPDEAGPGDSAGSRSLWRGWVCENCGRANCRFRWEVWQCLGCQKLLAPIDPYTAVLPAKALVFENALLGDPLIHPASDIAVQVRRIKDPAATVMIYTLPGRAGTIYHVVNDCNDFADGIFDRYQREAASTRVPLFQRRALNAHQIRGQLLAQHFAVNSGVSYKYNVDSCSLSFDDSPSCVIQALDAITLRTERVVGSKVEFNEVLSVLYREGQKMSWHDDGEPGLGPVVAGLSLGSSAVISWRRKSAHINANAAFNKGVRDPRKQPTPPIALSLTTSHGDIVMMQGRDMQKKYVHRVIPNGFRVAATARVIGK